MENCEIATRLIVGLQGAWPSDREWAWLQAYQPTGVILFSRNAESFPQLKKLCRELKKHVPDLEIMADHEGGPVSQLAKAVGRPPVAFALGQRNDTDLTRRVHFETGRRLKTVGIDRVLGPCADVLLEPRNPVIGARAFGFTAEVVSAHVAAAVKGLTEAGLSCCLKHWPGHGRSSTDTHLESSAVCISENDELPFQAGLRAGADALMPGHLCFDGEDLPATLSRDFLLETRQRLQIQGQSSLLLIADDVSMGALRQPMTDLGVWDETRAVSPEAVGMVEVDSLPKGWFEELLNAGCDQLLIRGIPFGAFPLGDPGNLPSRALFAQPEDVICEPVDFSDQVYKELRPGDKLGGFFDPDLDLALLDLARNDRWQVAGSLDKAHWQRWDVHLAANFRKIWENEGVDEEFAGNTGLSRLLVANHRPMPKDWIAQAWAISLKAHLAPSGVVLLMGHPSLKEEFCEFFGSTWAVETLYDVYCEDIGC